MFLASLGFLVPAFAHAADAKMELEVDESADVQIEDVLNGMTGGDAKMMAPGMSIAPYPPMGGSMVTVDVSYVQEVKPDLLNVTAYCSLPVPTTQQAAREELNALYQKIKAEVGTDGRVRKSGGATYYPYFDPVSGITKPDQYTGNLNITIRVLKNSSVERITELLESKNCSTSFDARLLNTQDIEMNALDELSDRLNKRKTVFEKLLGKKLKNISGLYLSTWADGWGTYDSETGTVEATTTLSVTYELSRASVR